MTELALDKVKKVEWRYDAILVDEGQNFSEDMFRIVSILLKKRTV